MSLVIYMERREINNLVVKVNLIPRAGTKSSRVQASWEIIML